MRLLKSIISCTFVIIVLSFCTKISANSYNWIHLVNISNPIPLTEIIKKYTAYDSTDGDLTNSLTFSTQYSHTNCQIGTYELIVSVKNSNNSISTQTDYIIVRDFVSPILISSITELHLKINDIVNEETLLPYLSYYDNLDEELKIIIENLPDDTSTEGIYNLIIYCLDSSTNKSNVIEITLYIEDERIKEILNYTLTTNSKKNQAEIINILKENNYIPTGYKNIELISSYFENNKPGLYAAEAIITLENDIIKVLYFKIEYVKANQEFPFYILYILGGMTVLITMFIIISKKRAQ